MRLVLAIFLLLAYFSYSDAYSETVVPEDLKTFNHSHNPADAQLRLLTVMNLMNQVSEVGTLSINPCLCFTYCF
jgi:hypothetical protein